MLDSFEYMYLLSICKALLSICRVLLSIYMALLIWTLRLIPAFVLHRPDDVGLLLCCSVLQCVAVCCSALQCEVVRCSASQCVAVHCSVLQWS